MMDAAYLIVGFALLFVSGHFLVYGGVELAKLLKIPTLVVGLTIVSFGTSAPELLVSVKAALEGFPDISMGNVIGSNISNIALVLGLTAIIYPLPVSKSLIRFDWPLLMFATITVFAFAFMGFINWWQGLILISILLYFNISSVYRGKQNSQENDSAIKIIPWYWSISIVALSSIGLLFGAEWLVKGATNIATGLGVSERIISVSIIAFGTSVPELATSVVAAFKKEADISIGNIIGSNLFNLAGILGITSLVKRITVSPDYLFDLFWLSGITILLFIFMVGKSKTISRLNGGLLILAYVIYMVFLLK